MNQSIIQFKQQRELGEIISITFKFIRENYKSFLKLIFKNVGPALVLLVAAVSYYSYSTLGSPLSTEIFNGGEFIISFAILTLALLLYLVLLNGTVFHFIKSYISRNGEIDETAISQGVKEDFGRLLKLGVISGLLIFLGLTFFILPGIYLSVPLSIAMAILVFKNEKVSGSISEAFYLVKDNWWITFFSLLAVWLMVYLISMIFQLPLIIYMFIKAFTIAQEGSAADMSGMFDWVYLLLTIISSLIQYILYAVIPVSLAFIYFHLNEKKNFTGTYESIEQLGKNN